MKPEDDDSTPPRDPLDEIAASDAEFADHPAADEITGEASAVASQDSDTGESADEDSAALAHTPAKPRGRFLGLLGLLGLLFGLGAMALSGYLYNTLVRNAPQVPPLEGRIAELEQMLAEQGTELSAQVRSQRQAVADVALEQREALAKSREQMLEAVNQLAVSAPPTTREWKVAEVAYLLRIANHRVLMEQDADGALRLLLAADEILAELDDFAFYQVRAALASEILALESIESSDLQGLFLRLEAVKTDIDLLELQLPSFPEPPPEPAESSSVWQDLLREAKGLVRLRRVEGDALRPLLAPEERAYLELNLRLMLERAQLAALRRDQVVFERSLETAAGWMREYLDEDRVARRAIEELEGLAEIQLNVALPDISGSLSALGNLGAS